MPATCLSFKPVTVSEQNREIPAWTSYKYLETPHKDSIVREYVLQEQDQRTYLMCPRGFAIAQVAVSLLLGKDQLEANEHIVGVYGNKDAKRITSLGFIVLVMQSSEE